MRTIREFWSWSVLLLIFAIGISACRQEKLVGTNAAVEPSVSSSTEIATPETSTVQIAHYNLGETTIIQEYFPEDSPFRHMPVRLDGVISIPGGEGSRPVVLIMHGSHAACPGENEWPCGAEEEQKNYEGFTYLVEALAEAGYIALSINVNAEHTFGFGEAPPTVRTRQIIDMHLNELAAADAGESDKFGLDVTDRVDMSRMVWLGHSRGGEMANRLLREHELSFENFDGDVQGLIQVAPSVVAADSLPAADLSLVVLLPACDQDLFNLEGQQYYESARLDPDRKHLALSIYLDGAVHNSFNAVLEPERANLPEDRPDCTVDTLLAAEDQQEFLVQFVADFLNLLYGEPDIVYEAADRLGILATEKVREKLYGQTIELNILPQHDDTLLLMAPESEEELSQNLLGGEVKRENIEVTFCPAGYYVPDSAPGKEPCKRVSINQPGYPQEMVFEWESTDAEWRTTLPDAYADITPYTALQFRTALDPLSDLNSEGQPQSFSVELTDASGQRVQVILPEIVFPIGVRQPNEIFEGGWFSGHVYMPTIRIPLEELLEIDLSSVTELALLFDQTETGAIFLADLALVRAD